MLILTRNPGQRLFIGDTIRIAVTRVHGRQVGLNVELPADIPIREQRDADPLVLAGGAVTVTLREALFIGDDIVLQLLGIRGNQVRLGTTAPRHVAVHREEIYERIQAKNANLDQSAAA